GTLNVYPYTCSAGAVGDYVDATVDISGNGVGISTQQQLVEVADFLDLSPDGLAIRRPAIAPINILPISRTPIHEFLESVETETISATADALAQGADDFLRTREPMIVGLTPPPRLDRITQGAVAGQIQGIATAEGATVASATLLY